MNSSNSSANHSSSTVLDHLLDHLRSRDVAIDGQARPVAVLWTDPKGEWRPLVEMLRTRLDELLVFGDFAPDARCGPAIWIRCLVDGALDQPSLPGGRAPVVYLPGVSRQELRAGEECRPLLRPLVELMYRGALWLQQNGSDWTVMAFLTSNKTLNLDISRDTATTEALLRALPEVALTPVAQLAGRRLAASDFDSLLSADLVRDLLRWMCDQAGTRARLGENGWGAFRNRCREEMDFDPEVEADVVAGERLGRGEGPWARVWDRFVESPAAFPCIAALLQRSRPSDVGLFESHERWPDLNEEDERALRSELTTIPDLPHDRACDAIAALEARHGARRGWVWARMGMSPLAKVLQPLARMAEGAKSALGGKTPDDIAATYCERGWLTDASAWEAMAACPTADEPLIAAIVRHLLRPWLDDSARAFQDSVARKALPGPQEQALVEAGEDGCLLFVDGLRYDLGQRLSERLEGRGYRVTVNRRWAALPTVTATSKPAVTPVADAVVGEKLGEYFEPRLKKSDKPVTVQVLRDEIGARGYQILGTGMFDAPMSLPTRGWLETGQIDTLGHTLETRLPRQIDDELDDLLERIAGLLELGWKSVRVVTDHGWLLLPGGLPKVDLPKHLTESRWARCAVIAGEATFDVPRAAWYWNAGQLFATAPGIACFNKTVDFAHGGLSVQECLIPDLLIERGGEAPLSASIVTLTWRGLRCFIEARASDAGVRADLRLERPSGPSVAASVKPLEGDGSVSLVLKDDKYEGEPLVLVLLDAMESVLAHRATRVGVNG